MPSIVASLPFVPSANGVFKWEFVISTTNKDVIFGSNTSCYSLWISCLRENDLSVQIRYRAIELVNEVNNLVLSINESSGGNSEDYILELTVKGRVPLVFSEQEFHKQRYRVNTI